MADVTFFQTFYPELKTTCTLNHSGTDFHLWKFRVTLLLRGGGLGHVLTEPKPSKDGPNHDEWVDDDFKARHIILGTLDDKLFIIYHQHETAKSMLDALTKFFARPSMGKKIMLFRRFMNHRMKEGTDIGQHITQMRGMAKDLELQGVKLPEDVQGMVLMESVPESWEEVMAPIRISIHLAKDEEAFGFNNVCQRLQSAGALKQLFNRDRDDGETSSMVSSRGGFKGKCYNCGQSGHRKSDCPN